MLTGVYVYFLQKECGWIDLTHRMLQFFLFFVQGECFSERNVINYLLQIFFPLKFESGHVRTAYFITFRNQIVEVNTPLQN